MTPPEPTPAALRAAVKILRHVQGNADNVPDDDIRALRSTATLARIIDAETRAERGKLGKYSCTEAEYEVGVARQEARRVLAERDNARAEVDRLRAALATLAGEHEHLLGDVPDRFNDEITHNVKTARAALDETRTQ